MIGKIALGCDGAGFELMTKIKAHLDNCGREYIDFGTDSDAGCDYPMFAARVTAAVRDGRAVCGILICGTGIGISIAANKAMGIRCALCHDTFSARGTREHNDANVLAMGARVVGAGLASDIVDIFLATPFSGEQRHIRRIEMITGMETEAQNHD